MFGLRELRTFTVFRILKPAQDYLDKALCVYKTLHDVISYLQNRIKEN